MNKIEYLKTKPKFQEKLAEYKFLGDLIENAAANNCELLISRSDFDAFGFDILVQTEHQTTPIMIQLKAFNGKTARWDVHKSLVNNPNGRIIITRIDDNHGYLSFKYYILKSSQVQCVLSTPPIKNHPSKCKVKKGDLVEISKDDLYSKVLTIYT